jgi:hypothetical protein
MMFKSLLVALTLFGLAHAKKAFAPKTSLLKIRGGAGPLDPVLVAKVATGLTFANAVPSILSPSKMTELYGPMNCDAINEESIARGGTAMLAHAIMVYCVLFKGSSLNDAVAAGTIPWIVHSVKTLLNDVPAKLGYNAAAEWILMAIGCFVAHTCWTNADYTDNVVKAYGIWGLLNGALCSLAPLTFMETWGLKASGLDKKHLQRIPGASILGSGVFITAMTNGVDLHKAIGYSIIPFLAFFVSAVFVTKEAVDLKLKLSAHYISMALTAAAVLTLAF